MKRLRKKYGTKIRFFHCGEYGEKLGRPHYHAIIFNHDFDDKKLWKLNNGFPLHTSAELSELWPFGFASIGAVNFQTAAYVARYIMKKITGKDAAEYYCRHDADGLIYNLKPEYTTMSRRPGIAHEWYEKFHADVYPHDYVIMNGKKCRPPRYYDNLLKSADFNAHPWSFDDVEFDRYVKSKKHIDNNTEERLLIREEIQAARLKQLKRSLD